MFGRKSSGGRKTPGRFMSGINDEIHGAHFDGDDIVLSEDLGGGRHRSVTIGGGIPETAPGEFRLVLGDFRVTSESGDPAVSVDTVPEALVQEILSSYKLSGVLSVYTPLKEDARMAVYRATGEEPLLYGDCLGFMARDFPNYRSEQPMTTGEGMPGPVCMFGTEADPDARSRSAMDTVLGFRVEGGSIILSADLGGTVLTVSDLGAVPDVPDGEYRALVVGEDVMRLLEEAGAKTDGVPDEVTAAISAEPVSREVAARICRSINRRGGLCVYTPRREDAMELASRLFVGGKPVEVKVPPSIAGPVAGVIGVKGKGTVRIAYGR